MIYERVQKRKPLGLSAPHTHGVVHEVPETSAEERWEFASLRKQYWGQRMWARGYFACSTGNITDEMIKDYIKNHVEADDDFHLE